MAIEFRTNVFVMLKRPAFSNHKKKPKLNHQAKHNYTLPTRETHLGQNTSVLREPHEIMRSVLFPHPPSVTEVMERTWHSMHP